MESAGPSGQRTKRKEVGANPPVVARPRNAHLRVPTGGYPYDLAKAACFRISMPPLFRIRSISSGLRASSAPEKADGIDGDGFKEFL